MWREPLPHHPHHRDDVTEVFFGREYLYQWCGGTRTVRRYRFADGEETIVAHAVSKPMTGQDFAQLFYNKKKSPRYRDHKPRKRNPMLSPHQRDVATNWLHVQIIEPEKLNTRQLSLVYRRIDPNWPEEREFVSHASAVARTRKALGSLTEGPWVLVDRLPQSGRVVSFLPRLHAVPEVQLPETQGPGRTDRRFPDDAEIRVLHKWNPKKEGSASFRRFFFYGRWCTVGEYIQKCTTSGISRNRAMADILFDWRHGYIEITVAGMVVTEAFSAG